MNRLIGVPGTVKRLIVRPVRVQDADGFDGRIYKMGECGILVAHEPAGPDGEHLWHLSISCRHRYPTWDEIKAAWYWLVPEGRVGAILLPLPENWVNIEAQDNVFHVWETNDPRAISVTEGQ